MIKKKKPAKLPAYWAPLPVKISNRFHQDLHKIYELSEFIRIDSGLKQSAEIKK